MRKPETVIPDNDKTIFDDLIEERETFVDWLNDNPDQIEHYTNEYISGPQTYDEYLNDLKNKELSEKLNSMIGILYGEGESRNIADCSGIIILSLREMGYDVRREYVETMTSGKVDWITLTPVSDNKLKQGDEGMLNFYAFGGGIADHVNVGVGTTGTPYVLIDPKSQVVDATQKDNIFNRWVSGMDGQYNSAGIGQTTQTFAPFSDKSKPFLQGNINWTVLEEKYKVVNK